MEHSNKFVLVNADTLARFGTEPNLIEKHATGLRQRMSDLIQNEYDNEDDDIGASGKLSAERQLARYRQYENRYLLDREFQKRPARLNIFEVPPDQAQVENLEPPHLHPEVPFQHAPILDQQMHHLQQLQQMQHQLQQQIQQMQQHRQRHRELPPPRTLPDRKVKQDAKMRRSAAQIAQRTPFKKSTPSRNVQSRSRNLAKQMSAASSSGAIDIAIRQGRESHRGDSSLSSGDEFEPSVESQARVTDALYTAGRSLALGESEGHSQDPGESSATPSRRERAPSLVEQFQLADTVKRNLDKHLKTLTHAIKNEEERSASSRKKITKTRKDGNNQEGNNYSPMSGIFSRWCTYYQ